MNRHRKAVYAMRREILLQATIKPRIQDFIKEEVNALVASPVSTTDKFESLLKIFVDEATLDRLFDADAAKFQDVLLTEARELYAARESNFSEPVLRKLEQRCVFAGTRQFVDATLREHGSFA